MKQFSRQEMLHKKIGVLLGGLSAEREISLKTGQAALDALRGLGYNAIAVDVDTTLPQQLRNNAIDIAFVALHGRFGEDGRVQGLLEMMQIPYTGSGVMASSMAIDKVMTKQQFLLHAVPTPEFDFMRSGDSLTSLMRRCREFPVVIKPSREGSTIGITIAEDESTLRDGLELAAKLDGTVLVEEFIDGRELTVSVVNAMALPIIEIVPKSGFYDYRSKYTTGATEYLLPAAVGEDCTLKIQQAALKACSILGCRGAVRADFMLRGDKYYCIEVNTIPGMTETSLLPKAAQAAGIDFPQLVELILLDAGLDK